MMNGRSRKLRKSPVSKPQRAYRNKETGEMFTYLEMITEWREKYEGINPETGLYQYHWHTRYEYIPSSREQAVT